MYRDDLLRRIRREHGGNAPELLSGVAGHVAVPRMPRPRRRASLLWIVVWVALAIGAVVASVYIRWPGEVTSFLGL